MLFRSADIGFCQDPDADRLALIDHTGHYIGEEYTLALCLDHVLAIHAGPIVTNCATSRMAQDLANKYGVPFHRSAVGEANVVAEMQAQEATFGGEGNGGPIDPRVGFVRDSFVGMALVLDGLATRQTALRDWVATIPSYAIHKTKVPLDRAALQPLGKIFRQRPTQIRPALDDFGQTASHQRALEATANGFNFWKFRHDGRVADLDGGCHGLAYDVMVAVVRRTRE